jgi:hypothetical protein
MGLLASLETLGATRCSLAGIETINECGQAWVSQVCLIGGDSNGSEEGRDASTVNGPGMALSTRSSGWQDVPIIVKGNRVEEPHISSRPVLTVPGKVMLRRVPVSCRSDNHTGQTDKVASSGWAQR